jgi:hypothetical protein
MDRSTAKPFRPVTLAIWILSLWGTPLVAQSIEGRLLDELSGAALWEGTVTLMDGRDNAVARAITDSSGFFRLQAPQTGTYRLTARRLGHLEATSVPFDLVVGQTLEVEFRLSVQPVALPPLTIVARNEARDSRLARWGYYDRRETYGKYGFARFLEHDEIQQHPSSVVSLLSGVPGIRIVRTGRRGMEMRTRHGRCMGLFVDGTRVGALYEENTMLLDAIPLSSIVAIEAYVGMVGPADFTMVRPNCPGAIVVWTGLARGRGDTR